MMKGIFMKYISRLVLVLAFAGVSYFSWAYINNGEVSQIEKKTAVIVEKLPKIKYDTALLSKFETLSKQLDPNREEYSLVGKLAFRDGADSSLKIQQVVYEVRKKGANYYCKLGSIETLNANGMSISIDHLNKQIVVSGQKELPPSPLFPHTKDLLKNLQKERYVLSAAAHAGEEKIQLLNNYHITCKEYTISYDKEKLKPVKLFARLTNFEDPESVTKEKVVTLYIDQCENLSGWDKIGQKKFVTEIEGKWLPIERYKNYKLYVL